MCRSPLIATKSASGLNGSPVGISRQALYLHFPDRASLLLALVAYVDEREDLQAGITAVETTPDAAGQIRAWAQLQSCRNPRIASVARALDQARHIDRAASVAWRDRTDNRMRGAVAIITRLGEEGRLHPSWDHKEAAALLWELTSFRVWDDLVNECGLRPGRYVEIVTAAALAALASPAGSQACTGSSPRDGISTPAIRKRRHTR